MIDYNLYNNAFYINENGLFYEPAKSSTKPVLSYEFGVGAVYKYPAESKLHYAPGPERR